MRVVVAGSVCILLVLILVSLSNSLDVTGGKSINQTSGGSGDGSQAPSPRDGPYIISYREPIGGYRDPSQYASPPVKFPFHDNKNSVTNSTTNSDGEITSVLQGFYLITDGKVEGDGTHSSRLLVNDAVGLNVRESSSARFGNLSQSSQFTIVTQAESYNSSMSAVSKKELSFVGTGYEELVCYSNNNDFIQRSLSSGAVAEDTIFAASVRNITNYDEDGSLSRLETGYREGSRFNGIYSFKVRLQGTNNTTVESSDYYAGLMQVKKLMLSSTNSSFRVGEDSLACCINLNSTPLSS